MGCTFLGHKYEERLWVVLFRSYNSAGGIWLMQNMARAHIIHSNYYPNITYCVNGFLHKADRSIVMLQLDM
jgi:hypothetical protein